MPKLRAGAICTAYYGEEVVYLIQVPDPLPFPHGGGEERKAK